MVRHNIPIVLRGHNDCAWGMIKHSQRCPSARKAPVLELGTRHYEKMVEGLGGLANLVTRDEDIIPALKRAFESGKPACVM